MSDQSVGELEGDVILRTLEETQSQRPFDRQLNVGPSFFEEYRARGFSENMAEMFHENTKNSLMHNRSVAFYSIQKFNETDAYQFVLSRTPDYPNKPTVELPDPDLPERSIAELLEARRSRRDFSGRPMPLADLSSLLHYSFGTTREVQMPLEEPNGDRTTLNRRTYPSAGGLYPVEIYMLVTNVDEVPPGVYYYKPEAHALRILKEDPEIEETIPDCFASMDVLDPREAAVTVVFASVFWRALAKYGPRGYRFILQESGHMAQNALLVAEAYGFSASPNGSFEEHALDSYLGMDGVNESSIYTISIGIGGGEDE